MKDTTPIREQLNKDIEVFLANGGKIQVIPPQTYGKSYEDIETRFSLNREMPKYD